MTKHLIQPRIVEKLEDSQRKVAEMAEMDGDLPRMGIAQEMGYQTAMKEVLSLLEGIGVKVVSTQW